MLKKFLITGILILFSSCTTGEKFVNVEEGMTRSEIKKILGKHDQIIKKKNYTIYVWKHRNMGGWGQNYYSKTDYYVVFNNRGVVDSYGHGAVDHTDSNAMRKWASDYQKQQLRQQEIDAYERRTNTLDRGRSISCDTKQSGYNAFSTNCREW